MQTFIAFQHGYQGCGVGSDIYLRLRNPDDYHAFFFNLEVLDFGLFVGDVTMVVASHNVGWNHQTLVPTQWANFWLKFVWTLRYYPSL